MTRQVVESIEDAVKNIIVAELRVDPDQLMPATHLMKDLGADSLDIVELVMALEEEFNIEISDEDAEKIRTVKDVVSYIEAHKS